MVSRLDENVPNARRRIVQDCYHLLPWVTYPPIKLWDRLIGICTHILPTTCSQTCVDGAVVTCARSICTLQVSGKLAHCEDKAPWVRKLRSLSLLAFGWNDPLECRYTTFAFLLFVCCCCWMMVLQYFQEHAMLDIHPSPRNAVRYDRRHSPTMHLPTVNDGQWRWLWH